MYQITTDLRKMSGSYPPLIMELTIDQKIMPLKEIHCRRNTFIIGFEGIITFVRWGLPIIDLNIAGYLNFFPHMGNYFISKDYYRYSELFGFCKSFNCKIKHFLNRRRSIDYQLIVSMTTIPGLVDISLR